MLNTSLFLSLLRGCDTFDKHRSLSVFLGVRRFCPLCSLCSLLCATICWRQDQDHRALMCISVFLLLLGHFSLDWLQFSSLSSEKRPYLQQQQHLLSGQRGDVHFRHDRTWSSSSRCLLLFLFFWDPLAFILLSLNFLSMSLALPSQLVS